MVVIYCGKWFVLHVVFGQIDADVMGHANTYLLIVTASIPFIALYNAGAAIFRSMGNSKVSMQVGAGYECGKCRRKRDSHLRVSQRDRRSCDSYACIPYYGSSAHHYPAWQEGKCDPH